MNEQQTIEYLSRLLNREVTADSTVGLTSGQRARFLSWAEQFGGLSADTRAVVSGSFSVRQLLSAVTPGAAPVPASQPAASGTVSTRTTLGASAGVGIDIQRIAEIVPYDDAFDFRSAADLAKIFSEREISYACARSSPTQTLAGLFAAKEAIIKADPALASRELRQIEILPDAAGAPAREGFQLSISHSGEYAVAMAIRLELSSGPVGAPESRFATPRVPAEAAASGESPVAPARVSRSMRLGWTTLLVLIAVVTGVLCVRYL